MTLPRDFRPSADNVGWSHPPAGGERCAESQPARKKRSRAGNWLISKFGREESLRRSSIERQYQARRLEAAFVLRVRTPRNWLGPVDAPRSLTGHPSTRRADVSRVWRH